MYYYSYYTCNLLSLCLVIMAAKNKKYTNKFMQGSLFAGEYYIMTYKVRLDEIEKRFSQRPIESKP